MIRWPRWLPLLVVIGLCTVPVASTGYAAMTPTTITFLTPPWGVPPDKPMLDAFTKATGITVQTISVPNAEVYSKAQVASAAGRAPADVIFLSEEAPSFIVAPGYLEPLDAYIAKSPDLRPNDLERMDFWKRDGKQQGITTYVQLVMMDYNAKRAAAAGISNPPARWDELVADAKQIKAKGVDQYPISMGAIDWSWYLIALSMGDPMFDASLTPVFANAGSPSRAAMATFLGMFKDGLISPDLLTKVTPHDTFMAGVGVFHQSWQGAHAVMNNPKISKQAPDVRYMLLPDKHYTWSLDAAIGISKFSRNKDAAWQFITWYVSPDSQQAIFKAVGLVPSRVSVQQALNKAGAIQQYDLLVEQSKYVHQLPRYATWWGPWTQFVTEEIRRATQGSEGADAAIDSIAKKWSELKAQYKK